MRRRCVFSPFPFTHSFAFQRESLQEAFTQLNADLASAQDKQRETEKEHEDLLVYLDEMSSKRRRDKDRLRALGQDVSADEDEDEDEE